MAEINTVIAEASQDLQTIEDFVNLPADSEVYPRLLPSVNVGTLAGAREAIFRAGGLPAKPFATKADMVASDLVDGDYAMVTDDTANNGLYVKTAGAWVKSDYDPLSQANSYADSNAMFKPQVINSSTASLGDLMAEGLYMPHNMSEAIRLGAPVKEQGVLLVTGNYFPDQLTQIYIASNGQVYSCNKRPSAAWSEWQGYNSAGGFLSTDNADNFKKRGVYSPTSSSGYNPNTNNLPSNSSNFTLYVSESMGRAKQTYISYKEIAFRYEGASGFTDWYVIPFNINQTVADIKQFREYQFTSGMDANTLKESAFYSSVDNSINPTTTNLPNNASKFILQVSKSNYAKQMHISYKGTYFRYEYSQGWSEWQGVGSMAGGNYDLYDIDNRIKDLEVASPTKPKIIYGWGSSTLGLAASYFTTMAERHDHVYVGHGVSGETLAVSGMQQGSNITTVKFTDATINNSTAHPVTITHSFKPKTGRAYKNIVLSNGVTGQLHFEDNTFTPTNLDTPLEIDTTYGYRATNPAFINQGKGLYYFDIGKNNMGYADTAQDIVDAQQQMIDYIPEGSEYLVGGHFVNTGTSGSDYANKVLAVNQILKLRYGLRFCDYYDFLYDDAIWTKYGITKTAEDIAAIAAGELPPSLGRDIGTGTRDTSHLRDEMSAEIALQAEARFIKLGYFS